jgi:carotenoid cleavage dioxygenase-like enzyme
LVIADTHRLEEGAVACVKLPFRVGAGIHGWWVSGEALGS